MALDRQSSVLRFHAFAVVFDADQFLAAEIDRDADPPRARVKGVFDEFLDDRRRTLHNFARRDLIREVGG
jgi:hypothetical protein